jgi:hypothetical protein
MFWAGFGIGFAACLVLVAGLAAVVVWVCGLPYSNDYSRKPEAQRPSTRPV